MLRMAVYLRRPPPFRHGTAKFSSSQKTPSQRILNDVRTEWRQMHKSLPLVDVNTLLRVWERVCTDDTDLLPHVWRSIQDHYSEGVAQEMLASTCAALWSKRKFDEIIAITPFDSASKLSVDVVDYAVRAYCATNNIDKAEAFLSATPHASNLTLQSRLVLAYASAHNIARVKSILVQRIIQQPTHMWTAQCCRNVMSSLCQLRDVSSMFEFLRRMTDRGIAPDSFVIASLLEACAATDNAAETARVLAILPTLDLTPHPVLSHAILHAHVLLGDFQALLPVIADMKDLPPHPLTPYILRQVCASAVQAQHYDVAAASLSSPDQFPEVVRLISPSDVPHLLAAVSRWKDLTPAQWTALLHGATEAGQFRLVLELFLLCPEAPDPSMLSVVENACSHVLFTARSETSTLQEAIASKCCAFLSAKSSPLLSTTTALITICLRLDRPQFVIQAMTEMSPSASKPFVLVGLKVARKLRHKRTLRTLYLAAPKSVRHDAEVRRMFVTLQKELRMHVLLPTQDDVLALVQAKQYAKAKASLSRQPIVTNEATWRTFLSHLLPSLGKERAISLQFAVDDWSFAMDACLVQQRYVQAIDLFVARVHATPTRRSAFVPSPTALLQLEHAISRVARQCRADIRAKLVPLLTEQYLSCPDVFSLRVRIGLMRVGLLLSAPDLVLLVLPEKPKQWDRTILRMVLQAAAQTNQLIEMYHRAPPSLQDVPEMRQELLHHVLLQHPDGVDWDQVTSMFGVHRDIMVAPSAVTLQKLADADAFGDVLRARTTLSADVDGALKVHPRWNNFLNTLAPQMT
ncbi:hypothetical protein H310_13793 [Aphanomyces invadans]|uniref:Pentacotripeptide-repeat region of PRORP domain-containing protein n=1 Tax=Aphanomyces invadans TaxID=157072 RepID=A0A024TCI6_9STRA|nr:hypothetical protein H310_13793 [Aphanomyces invadans]ETV91724.1 hypothetical protein H310_13793 [Aphanomyces invadans]|eukprot:XP_008879650.1 hypothetical protein H310_13793 [Aphanomyces invadans]